MGRDKSTQIPFLAEPGYVGIKQKREGKKGREAVPISTLVEPALTFEPDTEIEEVKKRIGGGEPISGIVVVQDERPLGLVMSLHMDRVLSHQFGVSLYYKRSISKIMDPSPLIVQAQTPLETVAHLAMGREKPKIYDHIIVTDQGLLQGTVSVQRILLTLAYLQQERANELARINNQLEREIQERMRIEAELRKLNAEIERSNQDLQDFTYTVSHDLQEPLRKIHTFGHFLEEDCGDTLTEEGLDYLHRMQAAAVRMRDLIRHLLSLSRVGTHGKKVEPVDPGQIINKAIDNLSEKISQCGGKIHVQENLPVVMADSMQLEQLFQNLVGNALKFTPRDRVPNIVIGAQFDEDMVIFSVADNGIGIEERYLEKIFGIFQRLHRRDQYEGTGVGLALCRKIVRRHGGRIWAESEPGRGTTFYFTLQSPSESEENSL